MNLKWWQSCLIAAVLLAVMLLSFRAGRKWPFPSPVEPPIIKVDTLIIRDTITRYEAKYYERRVIDSVLVPVTDTVRQRDTLYVMLEREQVRWEDSLAVVWASGIRPEVDSVRHFLTERIVVKEVAVPVTRRWGAGIQGGMGFGPSGMFPYIGVGISYNILAW